jgi:hypothetical protein
VNTPPAWQRLQAVMAALQAGRPRSAPSDRERLAIHASYAIGALLIASTLWSLVGPSGARPNFGDGLGWPVVLGIAHGAWLVWAVRLRPALPEAWFVSHVTWLMCTWLLVALAVPALGLVLAAGLLLVALVPPLAVVAVYGPIVAIAGLLLWLASRVVRGWLAFAASREIGPPPREPTAEDAQAVEQFLVLARERRGSHAPGAPADDAGRRAARGVLGALLPRELLHGADPQPGVDAPVELSAETRARIARGDLIGAIKDVRATTGVDLKTAKDIVDATVRRQHVLGPQRSAARVTPEASGDGTGRGWWIAVGVGLVVLIVVWVAKGFA